MGGTWRRESIEGKRDRGRVLTPLTIIIYSNILENATYWKISHARSAVLPSCSFPRSESTFSSGGTERERARGRVESASERAVTPPTHTHTQNSRQIKDIVIRISIPNRPVHWLPIPTVLGLDISLRSAIGTNCGNQNIKWKSIPVGFAVADTMIACSLPHNLCLQSNCNDWLTDSLTASLVWPGLAWTATLQRYIGRRKEEGGGGSLGPLWLR